MATPSYIRVYLDRFGSDTENYEVHYYLGIYKPDLSNPLFPDVETDVVIANYPRKKISFNAEKYVDIPMNQSDIVSFSIKRKDGYYVYNDELEGTEGLKIGPLDPFKYESGYIWTIDTNVNPEGTYYIKEGKPYVYKDNTFNTILAFGVSAIPTEGDLNADETEEENTTADKYRIFYTFKDYFDVTKPEEAYYNLWEDGDEPSEFEMLYLRGKSFNDIGEENMQLSLSAEALQAQKDDAKNMLESGIANSLFKMGESIADFDEDAFLADVDGFKAGKDASFHQTIDYMKVCIDNLKALE